MINAKCLSILALLAYEVHVLAPLSTNLPLPAAWPYATWKLLLKKRKDLFS
jgi:hypothetical protein